LFLCFVFKLSGSASYLFLYWLQGSEGANFCLVGEQVEMLLNSFGLDISDMGHLHADFIGSVEGNGKDNHDNGKIMSMTLGKFELLLQRTSKLHSLFNGHETYAELSKDQLHELAIHPWREVCCMSSPVYCTELPGTCSTKRY
jgi:hypothetical protein